MRMLFQEQQRMLIREHVLLV